MHCQYYRSGQWRHLLYYTPFLLVQFNSSSPSGQWRTPSHCWYRWIHVPLAHSNWLLRQAAAPANNLSSIIRCLHDPANVQQTSSKCIQNTRANAGRLLDRVNTLLCNQSNRSGSQSFTAPKLTRQTYKIQIKFYKLLHKQLKLHVHGKRASNWDFLYV